MAAFTIRAEGQERTAQVAAMLRPVGTEFKVGEDQFQVITHKYTGEGWREIVHKNVPDAPSDPYQKQKKAVRP